MPKCFNKKSKKKKKIHCGKQRPMRSSSLCCSVVCHSRKNCHKRAQFLMSFSWEISFGFFHYICISPRPLAFVILWSITTVMSCEINISEFLLIFQIKGEFFSLFIVVDILCMCIYGFFFRWCCLCNGVRVCVFFFCVRNL